MVNKIIVGSAQINNGFSGQYYLPYSIGILQAFVKHNSIRPDVYEFSSTIYFFMPREASASTSLYLPMIWILYFGPRNTGPAVIFQPNCLPTQ